MSYTARSSRRPEGAQSANWSACKKMRVFSCLFKGEEQHALASGVSWGSSVDGGFLTDILMLFWSTIILLEILWNPVLSWWMLMIFILKLLLLHQDHMEWFTMAILNRMNLVYHSMHLLQHYECRDSILLACKFDQHLANLSTYSTAQKTGMLTQPVVHTSTETTPCGGHKHPMAFAEPSARCVGSMPQHRCTAFWKHVSNVNGGAFERSGWCI